MATTSNLGPNKFDELTAASQVAPVTNQFDESKSTAGRVDSIIAKGSPLMQRAETRAKQEMNARGLTNSSMAVGAGQAAVIDAATPIAQADAGYFQNQQLANQQATNQGNQFNAGMRADIGTKGLSLMESARQFDKGELGTNSRFGQQLDQQNQQFQADLGQRESQFSRNLSQNDSQFARKLDQDVKLAGIDRDTRMALIQTEAKYKQQIAGNENISNAWATTMRDISTIQNNPDLEPATKTTLIDNTMGSFKAFTNFWQKLNGGNIDVGNLLSFSAGPVPASSGQPAAGRAAGGQPYVAADRPYFDQP